MRTIGFRMRIFAIADSLTIALANLIKNKAMFYH